MKVEEEWTWGGIKGKDEGGGKWKGKKEGRSGRGEVGRCKKVKEEWTLGRCIESKEEGKCENWGKNARDDDGRWEMYGRIYAKHEMQDCEKEVV